MADNLDLLRLRAKAKLKLKKQQAEREAVQEQPSFLERTAKQVVGSISETGAMIGGALGATTAGVPTLGLGAAGGAVVGAAMGGAAGKIVEEGIQSIFWPEESEAPGPMGMGNVVKGAAEGAAMETGGQIAGKVALGAMNKVANQLDEAATWLSKKIVAPTGRATEKLSKRVGGDKALKETARLLRDKGVTNTPGTLRKMSVRVGKAVDETGKAVGEAYKRIDKASTVKLKGQSWVDDTMDRFVDLTKEMNDAVNTQELNKLSKLLKGYFEKDKRYTHQEVHKVIRTMEKKLWQAADPERKALIDRAALALRQTNERIARQTLAEGSPLVDDLIQVSSQFSKLKSAEKAILSQLKQSDHLLIQVGKRAGEVATLIAAKTVAGTAGVAAVGAGKAASTPLGKSIGVSLADYGAQILARAPSLGRWGRPLARLAADKGYEAVAKRHAHLLVTNESYRKLWFGEKEPQAKQFEAAPL